MKRFSTKRAAAIGEIDYMKIRCGDHRFVYVWVVVADGRVFVRSWNDKPAGWYRAFQKHPRGAILVGETEVPIRAVAVTSAKWIDSASDAYAAKYKTKSNRTYVQGFKTLRRRATTLELIPTP